MTETEPGDALNAGQRCEEALLHGGKRLGIDGGVSGDMRREEGNESGTARAASGPTAWPTPADGGACRAGHPQLGDGLFSLGRVAGSPCGGQGVVAVAVQVDGRELADDRRQRLAQDAVDLVVDRVGLGHDGKVAA